MLSETELLWKNIEDDLALLDSVCTEFRLDIINANMDLDKYHDHQLRILHRMNRAYESLDKLNNFELMKEH